jgi:hypothetical protein
VLGQERKREEKERTPKKEEKKERGAISAAVGGERTATTFRTRSTARWGVMPIPRME